MFGPFREIVDSILAADESAPRKQRHTAQQVYRRLITEYGYTGGYGPVRSSTDRADRGIPHGLVEAFALFGCVPGELWWGNPATVAVHGCAVPAARPAGC